MATLSPGKLGIIILSGFLPLLLIRRYLFSRLVDSAELVTQSRRALFLDFILCFAASLLINSYNYLVLGFPLGSLSSFAIGCVISGFFIGLESSLSQERLVIHRASDSNSQIPLPTSFFSLTRKFTLVAGIATLLVSLVLIMVFVRDVDWLVRTALDEKSLNSARLSVLLEVLFIMGILLVLIINLILSYSKNLKLLFANQTKILEQVRDGNLSNKVPVATCDEFGLIAGHTNHMIDGLRHRFELISELRFAEEVQQNLLPSKSPFLKEFDVSGSSIYCDQTGGDYFDYFLLEEDRFCIVVADACGHGVGAAMLMTSLRAYFISAIQRYSDPASLLAKVNRLLSRDCSANATFITLFFMELDQASKSVRWVRAGHDPALLYRKRTAEFIELGGPGVALGVEETSQFENQQMEGFEQGDIILIGTDGIHETYNSHEEFFGKERMQEIIAAHPDQSAAIIRKKVIDAVKAFRGDLPQEDDLTLVVIKVK